MVSITYGHGFLDDGQDITSWSENVSGMTAGQASIEVENGYYFKLTGVCDAATDEYCYYEKDITNISSDTYTKFLLRWKTSVSSNGLGAKVVLVFTSGTQTILGQSAPEFSTLWNVETDTITPGKTIDKIRLYADDYPNSIDSGTYYVYYDFILLHRNTFTFPQAGSEVRFTFPPRLPILEIPGASGDITQNLGTRLATVHMRASDMELHSGWKRTSNPVDVIEGEILLDLWHNMKSEPWQWLDWDKGQMKVTLDGEPNLTYNEQGSGFDVDFREKRTASASEETYVERLGLNL